MTWPTPFKPVNSVSASGRSPRWPGVGWMRIGRPTASTAACSLVVRPPRDRPIAAASAPLCARRIGVDFRDGAVDEDVLEVRRVGQVMEKSFPDTGMRPAEPGMPPLSTCRIPLAGRASAPHCQPSTGSRPQTAGCPRRCGRVSPRAPGDNQQSAPIAHPSACVCSRLGSFASLESELNPNGNPANADTA